MAAPVTEQTMEKTPAAPAPAAGKPKTWAFTFTFTWDGPGLPNRAQTVEFFRSLTRRDLAIVAGTLALIFLVEPLFLYWLFSAKLNSRLDEHGSALTASLTHQIQTEVGPAMKSALSEQQTRVITTLNATDPTSLVLPSTPSTPPPPPPGKLRP